MKIITYRCDWCGETMKPGFIRDVWGIISHPMIVGRIPARSYQLCSSCISAAVNAIERAEKECRP